MGVFFIKKWKMGVFFVKKSGKLGVFCKKSGPFLNAWCIMYTAVSVFFILHFNYLRGAHAPNAPPPVYGLDIPPTSSMSSC